MNKPKIKLHTNDACTLGASPCTSLPPRVPCPNEAPRIVSPGYTK